MYKDYHGGELGNRSSDEDIFYPASSEDTRTDIDRSRRGRDVSEESTVFRDHYGFGRSQPRDPCYAYIRELHDALDRQEQEIKDLDSNIQQLRGEVREYFSSLELKLSCFEEKVDLVLNLVSSWANHPKIYRRCRGFCTKHVRTDKCLCRGLKEPHRCCGRIGGVCDC